MARQTSEIKARRPLRVRADLHRAVAQLALDGETTMQAVSDAATEIGVRVLRRRQIKRAARAVAP